MPTPRQYHPEGSIIFRPGDPGNAAYIVQSGEVEVITHLPNTAPILTILGSGDLLGDLAIIDGQPHCSSARAGSDVVLLHIDAALVKDLLGSSDPVTRYILQSLTHRLQTHQEVSGAIKQENQNGHLHASMSRMLSIMADLDHAIETHTLDLHYQPLINLRTSRVAGFEALLRWKPESLGPVSPDEFVSIAEQSGQIHKLGSWMLNRATSEWIELRESCQPAGRARPPFLSLNFSTLELGRAGIKDALESCLTENHIPANELHVELTERMLPVSNPQKQPGVRFVNNLQQVRDLGIGLVLDDMGTGYAGLETLMHLPFSAVKIDKSFVQKITRCERTAKIVKSMLTLAKSLGLHSTAEGIEDEPTHQMLVRMGCTYGQGFYYACPLPKADVVRWAGNRSPRLEDPKIMRRSPLKADRRGLLRTLE